MDVLLGAIITGACALAVPIIAHYLRKRGKLKATRVGIASPRQDNGAMEKPLAGQSQIQARGAENIESKAIPNAKASDELLLSAQSIDPSEELLRDIGYAWADIEMSRNPASEVRLLSPHDLK